MSIWGVGLKLSKMAKTMSNIKILKIQLRRIKFQTILLYHTATKQ